MDKIISKMCSHIIKNNLNDFMFSSNLYGSCESHSYWGNVGEIRFSVEREKASYGVEFSAKINNVDYSGDFLKPLFKCVEKQMIDKNENDISKLVDKL